MLVSLARASQGIMREKEGKKNTANEAKERTPVTRDREKGRNWTGGNNKRERERVKHRETEFGVLFITSELTSTTMPALRTVHRYFTFYVSLIRMRACVPPLSAANRIPLYFEEFSPNTERYTTDRKILEKSRLPS